MTLDLEYRPIDLKLDRFNQPATLVMITGIPVIVQVKAIMTYPWKQYETCPVDLKQVRKSAFDCLLQDTGHKEMIRSHEMLRHSPSLSMLFDSNGELIQACSTQSFEPIVNKPTSRRNKKNLTGPRHPTNCTLRLPPQF